MPTATVKMPQQQKPPVPAAGSIAERIATARAVGYGPGVPDGPAETCRDIERIIYTHLGWEQ
jgi:hypothetical protein